jgi:hypothetical protein
MTKSSRIQYRRQKKQVQVVVQHKDKASAERALADIQSFLLKSINREKNKKKDGCSSVMPGTPDSALARMLCPLSSSRERKD